MAKRDDLEIIRTKIEPKLDEIKNEFKNVFDREIMDEVIRTSRELNSLSTDDLLKPFTI